MIQDTVDFLKMENGKELLLCDEGLKTHEEQQNQSRPRGRRSVQPIPTAGEKENHVDLSSLCEPPTG
jgi:hypothetical protein